MLVLTRHVHQSIVIGHDVIVTVLEVRGDQVRLGITAPKDIQVHREEVFAALTAANRQAATSASELEVLKELSSEPIASSKDGPRQRPGTGGGAPASPRREPGLASPANPDSGPGQQSTTGPGSRLSRARPSVAHRARFGPLGKTLRHPARRQAHLPAVCRQPVPPPRAQPQGPNKTSPTRDCHVLFTKASHTARARYHLTSGPCLSTGAGDHRTLLVPCCMARLGGRWER